MKKAIQQAKAIVENAGLKFPEAEIVIDNSLSESAGECITTIYRDGNIRHKIVINESVHETDESLVQTLLHEVSHALANEKHRKNTYHGRTWREYMLRLGQWPPSLYLYKEDVASEEGEVLA